MKSSKIIVWSFALIITTASAAYAQHTSTLSVIDSLAINVSARQNDCRPNADSIFFTDAGTSSPPVNGVHPGKGYDLNIFGSQAFYFEVIPAQSSSTKDGIVPMTLCLLVALVPLGQDEENNAIGLALNGQTGELSGTPTKAGSFLLKCRRRTDPAVRLATSL